MSYNTTYECSLCKNTWEDFYNNNFLYCSTCQSISRKLEFFLSPEKEKERYEQHNNDIYDVRYQEFVSPIVQRIQNHHPISERGLDFWAWSGPVITYLLEKQWYEMYLYDPFFHKHPNILEKKYDFIIACEVVEHFHDPFKEFKSLYDLLQPGGKLYIMTDLYSPGVDFWKWYYKNDPTHVFFYSDETFHWIQQQYGWKKYSRKNRCIILER